MWLVYCLQYCFTFSSNLNTTCCQITKTPHVKHKDSKKELEEYFLCYLGSNVIHNLIQHSWQVDRSFLYRYDKKFGDVKYIWEIKPDNPGMQWFQKMDNTQKHKTLGHSKIGIVIDNIIKVTMKSMCIYDAEFEEVHMNEEV